MNFFLPSQKLVEKIRQGSPVQRRYDPARTPYQRVLESSQVKETCKQKLRAEYAELNPAELDRKIRRVEETLWYGTTPKQRARAVDGAAHSSCCHDHQTITYENNFKDICS